MLCVKEACRRGPNPIFGPANAALQGNKTQYSLLLNDRGLYEAHTLEDVQGFAQEFINHQALVHH